MFWLFKEKIYFSCNQCGECCKGMDIPLTHIDVYRIIKSQKAPEFEDFISLLNSNENDPDALLLYGFYQSMYLTNKNTDNSCIFLKDNICSIYFYRPNSCSTWPFSKNSMEKLYIDNVANKITENYCDKTRFKSHNQVKRKIDNGIKELIEYRKFVRYWNKMVKNETSMQNFDNLKKHIILENEKNI